MRERERGREGKRERVLYFKLFLLVQDKRVSLPVLTDKERGGGGGGGRDVDSAAAVINEEATLFNKIISKFTFVDLAGSERVNRTHNTGERFKGN